MHTLNGIDNVGGCNSVWSRFSRILNYITYVTLVDVKSLKQTLVPRLRKAPDGHK